LISEKIRQENPKCHLRYNVSGAYDVRITYFDEKNNKGLSNESDHKSSLRK